MKPNFTVCLIAKDEERTLPRLVASLKEFQDAGGEILIADTGSNDKTVEVARALGCTVFECGAQFKRVITKEEAEQINAHFLVDGEKEILKEGDGIFDFSAARNWIAEKAKEDMICMPDCDEIYTKFDLEKVCQAIEDGNTQLEYNFVFAHDEYNNPTVQFMHCKFYDKTKLKWVGIVHECLFTI